MKKIDTITLSGKYGKDCKIYSNDLDINSISFLYDILNNPVSENNKIRIMPDVHYGNGCIVGFTMKIQDQINPEHIGCDIGCTVSAIITKTSIPENIELEKIDYKIRNQIPTGMNINDKPVIDEKDFYKFLRKEYSKAKSSWPEVLESINIDENYISKMLKRLNMDPSIFYKSLGTLGGGNHFIEISKTDNDTYALIVHSGSRNFGIKVWKYWTNISKNPRKIKNIKEKEREIRNKYKGNGEKIKESIQKLHKDPNNIIKGNGYLFGEDMIGYLTDMVIAQAYAKYNHITIQNRIIKSLKWRIDDIIWSVHNYIDFTDHILRKGSTRSYLGEKLLIPLNMKDGTLICEGKSNEDWNYSAPHGLGRRFSRSESKNFITLEDYIKTMKGIYSSSICKETIDESPMAYKDPNYIMNQINDTVTILYRLYPIINIKSQNILDRNEQD